MISDCLATSRFRSTAVTLYLSSRFFRCCSVRTDRITSEGVSSPFDKEPARIASPILPAPIIPSLYCMIPPFSHAKPTPGPQHCRFFRRGILQYKAMQAKCPDPLHKNREQVECQERQPHSPALRYINPSP